jgi:hypothetical protein
MKQARRWARVACRSGRDVIGMQALAEQEGFGAPIAFAPLDMLSLEPRHRLLVPVVQSAGGAAALVRAGHRQNLQVSAEMPDSSSSP